jgi:two-component system C4-dicarboxylate transport response regulator DctD
MSNNTSAKSVLVIDDDKEMRDSLTHLLSSAGWRVDCSSTAMNVEDMISRTLPDVILTDVQMPKRSGLDLLRALGNHNAPPIVLISAHGDIPMAVDAMQQGAYSFLEKPFEPRRLLTILDHAADKHKLQEKASRLKARLADLSGLNRIFMGKSDAIQEVREQVLDYSDARGSLLILGETGTGKELVAHALHDLSANSDSPFVAVNCAAIPIAEFEEATFGRKGAVTGLLTKADGGTLFLDEVTSAPPEIQAKLLRVFETKTFTPLGSDTPQTADVRIIAAANEDVQNSITSGRLREDFFYRLSGLVLKLPSLRDHIDDIPMLFEHFMEEYSRLYESKATVQSTDDIAALMSHSWPGNVRELRSVAERCVLASRRGRGNAALILRDSEEAHDKSENLRNAVASFERTLISKALLKHGGKMDEIAEALGIGRRTLNEKIVKLGLDKNNL